MGSGVFFGRIGIRWKIRYPKKTLEPLAYNQPMNKIAKIHMSPKPARRKLAFNDLDEMLAEAKSLVDAEKIESTGEWTLAQALMHLALNMRLSLDGAGKMKRPFIMKLIGPIILRRTLKKGFKPGYQLPERQARLLVPKAKTKLGSAWDAFERQAERMKESESFHPHPALGPMTREQSIKFAIRHAEHHLSYHTAVS